MSEAIEQVSLRGMSMPESHSNLSCSANLATDPFEDTFQHVDISQINPMEFDSVESIPFFMGGDRRTILDEVLHLCQFSNNLVAVLGEAGVGKTALVYQAVVELSESAQCCVLTSSVMTSVEAILQQLITQLGVFVPEPASLEQMLAVINHYHPTGVHQRVVIVVDDAHHLNNDIFSVLIQILQHQTANYFHVLLVGDSSLLLRLDSVDKGDVLVYDIPLCPFTLDELEHYLAFKLAAVGYAGGEVFDGETVYSIWQSTRGIPISVNRMARNLLLAQAISTDDDKKLGLPMAYMAMLVVLLAALIMALFYIDGDVLSESESSEKPLVTDEPSRQITDLGEKELAASNPPPSILPIVESESKFPKEKELTDQLILAENTTKDIVESATLAESNAPLPAASDVPLQITPQATVDETRVDKEESTLPPVPDVVSVNKLPSLEPVTVKPSTIQPATVPSTILTVDEQAVMFWPDTDAPWYAVLVGVYGSLDEARLAIKTLPKEQVAAKPWPRKISEVKAKIQDFRSKK
jgi:DamX protein